jgi:DNA-binding NarL/FixJ family response regulator
MSAAPSISPVDHRGISAVVLADLSPARRDIVRLLARSGIAVTAADAGAEGATGDCIVLARTGDARARLDAIAEVAGRHPNRPLVTTMPSDAGGATLRRALRQGADGIVLDDDLARTLVPTVAAVAAGALTVPRSMRRQIAPRALSHREKQALGLVVLGYTNRQIADTLFVAESTVKTHLSSAFAKLDARSRSEAAALIVDPEEGYGLGILAISGETPPPAAA